MSLGAGTVKTKSTTTMETVLEILKISGLGLLGILLYAVATVWKKIRADGFSSSKFFNENLNFWLVCLVLNILFAVVISIVPDFQNVLHTLGFAIEDDSLGGYVLLGIALAAGSDKTSVSGTKLTEKK